MKKIIIISFSSALLIFILIFVERHSLREQTAQDDRPKNAGQQKIDSSHIPALSARGLALRAKRSVRSEPLSLSSETQTAFRDLIKQTNMLTVLGMEQLVQRLRDANEDEVASFFQTELIAIGSQNPDERGRLVFAANALQSDKLAPFWTDLLYRETPAFTNEVELLKGPELVVSSRALLNELSMSVRNLGLIGMRDTSALDILQGMIESPLPGLHSTVLREEALTLILENDPTKATQIILNLDESDQLRGQLNAHSK